MNGETLVTEGVRIREEPEGAVQGLVELLPEVVNNDDLVRE